ncbi:MAG: hypothetical protein ACHQF2_01900 [Flavobacteriales bacterium]
MRATILLINLIILAVYMGFYSVFKDPEQMFGSAFLVLFHILGNVLLAVFNTNQDRTAANTYLLSAVLVLLIGFPTCLVV